MAARPPRLSTTEVTPATPGVWRIAAASLAVLAMAPLLSWPEGRVAAMVRGASEAGASPGPPGPRGRAALVRAVRGLVVLGRVVLGLVVLGLVVCGRVVCWVWLAGPA